MSDQNVKLVSTLLDIPVEVRLRVYTFHFRSTPVFISKHCQWSVAKRRHRESFQQKEKDDALCELLNQTKRYTFRMFGQSLDLLLTCKQISREARSAFFSASPFDFRKYSIQPRHLPDDMILSIRHIICSTEDAEAWLSARASVGAQPRLPELTLMDGSLLLYSLTQSPFWGFHGVISGEPKRPGDTHGIWVRAEHEVDKLDGLRRSVAISMASRVRRLIIRNAKQSMRYRSIVIDVVQQQPLKLRVIVKGIHWVWQDTAQQRITAFFNLKSSNTKFTFIDRTEMDLDGGRTFEPLDRASDVDYDAGILTDLCGRLQIPQRPVIKDNKVILKGKRVGSKLMPSILREIGSLPVNWDMTKGDEVDLKQRAPVLYQLIKNKPKVGD